MLCHKDFWFVRHKDSPDVPFEIYDKETLKKKDGETPFKSDDSEIEDYLKWTPLDTEFEENKAEGNRWMRASPMFSDGEFIYMMVQYREKDFKSPIVKTVCEVYEVSEDRTMKRIEEVSLFKAEGEYYSGSKKTKDHGGHLARGSLAYDGHNLLWWSNNNFHVYNFATGMRIEKRLNNCYISVYDPIENWYYVTDVSSYGWLKRVKVSGFQVKAKDQTIMKIPDLPIVLDSHKGDIIAHLEDDRRRIKEIEDNKS